MLMFLILSLGSIMESARKINTEPRNDSHKQLNLSLGNFSQPL